MKLKFSQKEMLYALLKYGWTPYEGDTVIHRSWITQGRPYDRMASDLKETFHNLYKTHGPIIFEGYKWE